MFVIGHGIHNVEWLSKMQWLISLTPFGLLEIKLGSTIKSSHGSHLFHQLL